MTFHTTPGNQAGEAYPNDPNAAVTKTGEDLNKNIPPGSNDPKK